MGQPLKDPSVIKGLFVPGTGTEGVNTEIYRNGTVTLMR